MKTARRDQLAFHHLWSAAFFARQLANFQAKHSVLKLSSLLNEYWSFAIGSVLSSVAFLEASVNEPLSAAAGPNKLLDTIPAGTRELWEEMWNRSLSGNRHGVLEKYEITLTLARLPGLDRGKLPYQDAAHLVALRNALVHFKPEWLADTTPPDADDTLSSKLAARLANRFPPSKFMGPTTPFLPARCLGHGCAAWSVRTVTAFSDEFFRRLNVVPFCDYARDELRTEP